MITMKSICDWAGTNPSQRKFVEGEWVYQAGHIIKCGKNESAESSDTITFTAVCLQTSSLKENPHEINGVVSKSVVIISCTCSCKAGLGEKCKHIIAALLYCYQKGSELESLSCIDAKCKWKQVHNKALESYSPAPLLLHSCFAQPVKRKKIINDISTNVNDESEEESADETGPSNETQPNSSKDPIDSSAKIVAPKKRKPPANIEVSNSQLDEIKSFICHKMQESALEKHTIGRHEPIVIKEKTKINEVERELINLVLQNQDSDLMRSIQEFKVNILQDCCLKTIEKLAHNLQEICEKTKYSYAVWILERQQRITGSICYGLYTFTKKKRADSEWELKCKSVFTPKDFKSEFTEHGKMTESEARDAFRKTINGEVFEVGLVVSRLNPWLAYSPDGIIVKEKKTVALLEIKCPIKGKTANIQQTIATQKYLVQEGENTVMKEKHPYYGQIQLGMAVLNLSVTYFVIYSSFDKKLFVLRVYRNNIFLTIMLKALKKMFYRYKLHEMCYKKSDS